MTKRNSNSDLHFNLYRDSQIMNDGERVEIQRPHKGTYKKGIFVKSDFYDSFFIKASIQPASGDQILQVPENDRTKQVLNIFSPTDLVKNDILVRNGCRYEIQNIQHWGSHSESLAVLIDVV